jgi:predicted ferric reductase
MKINKYAVALTYCRNSGNNIDIRQILSQINAKNENEALEIAIKDSEKEAMGFGLVVSGYILIK